jgi:adhesin transport system outer membrane protein
MHFVFTPISTSAAGIMQSGGDKTVSVTTREPAIRTDAAIEPNSSQLLVNISAGREHVTSGEFLHYDLTVLNTSKVEAAPNIRIFNVPPDGFRFKSGSFQLGSANRPDPAVLDGGKAFVFSVGTLAAADSVVIRFEVEVTAGSKLGKAVNYASAISGGRGNSNIANASVLVKDNQPRTKDNPPESSQVVTVPVTPPAAAAGTVAPEPATIASETVQVTRNLTDLVGVTDISVNADADGQFVKNVAENQILKNESVGQVGDTNIFESIRTGRGFNRESLAALARTEQAKAQTGQAFGLLLPSVSVRVNSGLEISSPSVAVDGAGKALSSDTHSRTDAALTVRQPLFDLPGFRDWRRRKMIEQARGENYRVSDGDAYISAVNAYLSLVSSRLLADMTRDFETQLSDLLTYIEKRAKAGATSISDMARVRARSQATLSSRLELESAHAAAGIEFVRLTNLVPRKVRLPVLEDVGVSLLPKSFDKAVTVAMKLNPEIGALTAELQAAELDKSAAKGRYLPRVDAEYTYNYALHAGGDTSSSGQKDQRIMAVLNWSLFSGGSDYNIHVERSARYKELQYRLDDQRRRVFQTLSANYATLTTTRERITSGYQEMKSISTASEAMSKRMLSGNQSLLDLLDVYDRFYQVRSRLVNLHILEMSTVAQIVRLTRGIPEDVPEGNLLKADN